MSWYGAGVGWSCRFLLPLAWLLSWSTPIAAQPVVGVQVAYQAPPNCPDTTEFSKQLLARTARVRFQEHADLQFIVEVTAEGGIYHGRIQVRRTSAASDRVVQASSCAEVVEALALVGALTIDPDAATGDLSEEQLASASETLSAQVQQSAVVALPPENPPPPAEPSPPPPAEPAPTPPRLPPEDHPPARSVTVAVGAAAELAAALAPTVMPVGRLFWELRTQRDQVGMTAGLSLAGGATTVVVDSGEANLDWLAVRADLCPVGWRPVAWLLLRGCAMGDIGQLRGRGKEGEARLVPHEASQIWGSAGSLARVELLPGGPWMFRVDSGVVVPFVSEAGFTIAGEDVLNIPIVAWGGAVGLGLLF